ncbi:MAG: bifunctional riboflavin kinase/FAD synthetase [Pseudomonadales bacterium]|nr:bifunctional riboflavin kinase/FAD synthetase [Pseudomonadales bacterium]
MEVIRGAHNIRPEHRGCVITIGNFDGVHLGHQAILHRISEISSGLGASTMLICFEPQPKEFFMAFDAPARLTRFREKAELLAQHGIDYLLCLQFNEAMRTMGADEFVSLLVDQLAVKGIFIGDDTRFGKNREGGIEDLRAAGKAHGFQVTNMYTLNVGDDRVSSTRIRECLAQGDFSQAEALLGRPYSIKGKVVYGRQLGRTLDAPTANIQLNRYRAPLDGSFAVEIVRQGKVLKGVANVGVRPTLNETTPRPLLEVHIFDFSGSLYGERVEVIFRHKIRDEKKFSGLDELKAAIRSDMNIARTFFGLPPLS